MTTQKKIGLIIVIVLVVGSIWYLKSIQAHPGAGAGGAGQAISVDSTQPSSTQADAMASGTAPSAMPSAGPSSTKAFSAPGSSSGAPTVSASVQAIAAADKKAGDQPAIEIADPTGFVNVPTGFTLGSLIGKKVILLDFWTYSCINCIRTIPYLNAWYQKYASSGLEIVGIHTPEFDFEKNINNVSTAVMQDGIKYPVVLDSNYGTWNAYGNLYWPHEYLIDIAGYIVHDHVGEGDYDATEAEIQKLLAQRATALGASTAGATVAGGTVNVPPPNLDEINSPETYFGANRNSLLANGYAMVNGTQDLAEPKPGSTALNHLYLGGTWVFEDEYATNPKAGAKVFYTYNAGKVYFVASASPAVTVEVLQDGAPISSADAGSDVHDGKVIITGSRLYNIVNNHDGAGEHDLELVIDQPGIEAFTFTFG